MLGTQTVARLACASSIAFHRMSGPFELEGPLEVSNSTSYSPALSALRSGQVDQGFIKLGLENLQR